MIEHTGNMWDIYKEADYFIFTGNSYIKQNGALVMGRGMAKEVRDKFPGIDKLIGSKIRESCEQIEFYGLIVDEKIGVFQVKYHYDEESLLTLIQCSVSCLKQFAKKHLDKQIHMNYPGIGFGGLTKKEVAPLLKCLSNNVHIWSFYRRTR